MTSVEEVVDFITENNNVSFDEIIKHSDVTTHDLQDILREAEIQGMVIRKMRNKKEFWST